MLFTTNNPLTEAGTELWDEVSLLADVHQTLFDACEHEVYLDDAETVCCFFFLFI